MIHRAYYEGSVYQFLQDHPDTIFGALAREHTFSIEALDRNAWLEEIRILKTSLINIPDAYILLEFGIPRMGKRVDVVILHKGIIFVLEFKVGETTYPRDALLQVIDYALDLKNFHEQSHSRPIIPILVATGAKNAVDIFHPYEDQVYHPLRTNRDSLVTVIQSALQTIHAPEFDPHTWVSSVYKPTPTIIEAAQALYKGHNVHEISRSDAGAINLSKTSDVIDRVIEQSRLNSYKTICFVTGIPGAGKTLAGLNIATTHLKMDKDEHAVFLSGNGPLVTVLREALARNEVETSKERKEKVTKRQALSHARTFIQNVHHFRDEGLLSQKAPVDHVIVFDEAQRAWTKQQTANFMKRKKGLTEFQMSEPEFLVNVMDRHADWAVIVCLVGGGQEINTGEAGLPEWFETLENHFPHWHVYVSDKLDDRVYTRDKNLLGMIKPDKLHIEENLHLAVSVRSFRAENVSDLINAILNNCTHEAQRILKQITPKYPIVLTHDLNEAKKWLRNQARGSERYGLLASSGAYRLRPIGVNVRSSVDVEHWFLDNQTDVRSSYYLEEVATEFDIQGLELDWVCIVWDADFRYQAGKWTYNEFRGTKWQQVKDLTRQLYLTNAYRVLLTRARQGMVICIPSGNPDDITRLTAFYDGTFEYLKQIGFEII